MGNRVGSNPTDIILIFLGFRAPNGGEPCGINNTLVATTS